MPSARHHVARRKLSARNIGHEAPAGLVDQDRAVAPHRLADKRRRSNRHIERGRMELDELEVGQFGPGPGGEREALAEAAERIGAAPYSLPIPPVAMTTACAEGERLDGPTATTLARRTSRARLGEARGAV